MHSQRVLLVEHALPGRADLAAGLGEAGFSVDRVEHGEAALQALGAAPYTLLLLDLEQLGESGLLVLGMLRRRAVTVPSVVFVAREAVQARIAALDAGADDYLIRPFVTDELLARIRVVQRRHAGQALPILSAGRLRIDPTRHQAWLGGSRVALSPREFVILQELMMHAGAVISGDELKRRLDVMGDTIASNVLQVHIHNLRRKLGRLAIVTVRGVGYRVNEEV
ncbi:MAG: winged helix-turn-helix domain-containing protein [Burkholderia sp.]